MPLTFSGGAASLSEAWRGEMGVRSWIESNSNRILSRLPGGEGFLRFPNLPKRNPQGSPGTPPPLGHLPPLNLRTL